MNILARWKQPQETRFVERRVKPRLRSKEGPVAFLSYTKTIGGQIQDINEHGLSFRYVASRQKSQGQCFVDIMMRDGSPHYHRLPCAVVWDNAVPKEFSLGPFTMRVCGAQLGELTAAQKANVKYFVQQYTRPNPFSQQVISVSGVNKDRPK